MLMGLCVEFEGLFGCWDLRGEQRMLPTYTVAVGLLADSCLWQMVCLGSPCIYFI